MHIECLVYGVCACDRLDTSNKCCCECEHGEECFKNAIEIQVKGKVGSISSVACATLRKCLQTNSVARFLFLFGALEVRRMGKLTCGICKTTFKTKFAGEVAPDNNPWYRCPNCQTRTLRDYDGPGHWRLVE